MAKFESDFQKFKFQNLVDAAKVLRDEQNFQSGHQNFQNLPMLLLSVSKGTGRFGKVISAKEKLETFRQIFHAETSCIILVPYYLGFVFGFLQTG